MNCKGVRPLLSAYLDRELEGDAMLDIRTHLGTCHACREEVEDLRSLKRLLGNLQAPEPPADLEARLVASVVREQRPTRFELPRRALVFAGVAACSMLTTLAILASLPTSAPTPAPTSAPIAFEIERDRILMTGSSPLGGAPLVSAASYDAR